MNFKCKRFRENKTTLQCDEVFECLKATNGHATRNVLKRFQSLMYGAPILETPSTPFKLITPNLNTNMSLDFIPSRNDGGEKSMTKLDML
jgi:hypothetical protein